MSRSFLPLTLIASVALASNCGAPTEKASAPDKKASPPRIATDKDVRFVEDEDLEGLRMILREVEAKDGAASRLDASKAEILAADETERLLSRVDTLKAEDGDRKDFAVRAGSPPPPLKGAKVDVAFPPEDRPAPPETGTPGKLEVVRFAPEGDVRLAPHLSVTFSRPMVAVTSQEEAAKTVPARLEPTPPGSWRWLGTRTSMFAPDGRFPMATRYEVTVPAGTRSATGDPLEKAVEFAFTTPPPTVERSVPEGGPQDLDPVIFLAFDQRVHPEEMAKHVRLEAGSEGIPLRLADADEIADDDVARALAAGAQADRWLALVATAPLAKGTTYKVRVKKGAPSAEGPLTTERDQVFSFFTYNPLRVEDHRCGWSKECPPTAEWRIEMNNPLDEDEFDPTAITVEPAISGLQIRQFGDTISITGQKRGRTKYTVVLPESLEDVFGQTLGKKEHLTFEVGPAEETLFGPGKGLVTLDPAGPPALPIHSINHPRLDVKVHRVTPADWPKWLEWRRKYMYETDKPGPMPGTRVMDRRIDVKGEPDEIAQTMIDLSRYLEKGHGQFLVKVEPTERPADRWRRQEVLLWVQVTHLGLTAFVDYKELLAWSTRLADGAGLSGVTFELSPGAKAKRTSDSAGLARFELPDDEEAAKLLVARTADDLAILPANDSLWYDGGGWRAVEQSDRMSWYAFDDRGLYRPGEEVRVKGWIRQWEAGVGGDVGALEKKPRAVRWKLRGSRGNDLAEGEVALSALDGFDVAFTLPKDANLGTAWLELEAQEAGSVSGTSHSHPIKIQEFRRPEFEVKAEAGEGPWVLGEEATVTVEAAYYAGGGLQGAPVRWNAYASAASYTPPNRGEYSFGPWSPWWRHIAGGPGGRAEALEGKTDAVGAHHLGIRFEAMNPPRPMSVRAEATVTDVNRQAWTASKDLLVHPSAFYIGLKQPASFFGKGEKIDVEAIVVDIEGAAVPGAEATVRMARLESVRRKGEWVEEEVDPVDCAITSGEEAKSCEFSPAVGGRYRITGTVRDPLGRKSTTELMAWVEGAKLPPARDVEQETLTLVPKKEEYRPGEKASFLVQAPFHPASGVLTIRRSGLVREERFEMEGPTKTFEIPILAEHIPDVTVQVDLVGSAVRSDDQGNPRVDLERRVAFATGSLTFKVPPLDRTLEVKAGPKVARLAPGGKTIIDVTVRDAAGKPTRGAELVVVAADESVLALTGYKLPDPIGVFYAARGPAVSDYHSRHQVLLTDPSALQAADAVVGRLDNMAQAMVPLSAPGYGGGGGGLPPPAPMRAMKTAEAEPTEGAALEEDKAPMVSKKGGRNGGGDEGGAIAVRTDFNALALFAANVVTDAKGKASIPISLPDSLTRYRIMVVAVAGGSEFGTGESNVTARLPLMARPSAPRFLNFGDRFELPVVLQNQTDDPMTVDVAVRASNVSLADSLDRALPSGAGLGFSIAGRRVSVPANDRVEVRFPAAAGMAGTARFQVVAASKDAADAASFDLPVWTPATSEAFATYGEIDKGVVEQPIRAPGDAWPQFGGLEVTTSSTQLQALTDAVLYLASYPFDCNEQIASRILAISALRDVLTAFEAEGLPPSEELERSVDADLARLEKRQNNNGGFSFWRKGDQDWPYLTVHVAGAMARAKAKGYAVPQNMWNRAARYLSEIESHIPHWYSRESRWAIRAYALDVLHRMGKTEGDKARALLAEAGLDGLSMEALGWILPVLHAAKAADDVRRITRHLENNVAETAGGAHFVTGYSDGAHVLLHSDRRVDGVLLEALIEVAPKSDLIPKLVRGLLAHRTRGKWSNTQENAFILLAMDRYFSVFEKVTPDFVARAWLGEAFAGEHRFVGRTTERANIDIPMSFVAKRKGDQSLVLQKDGKGRMYYRIGMRYAPKSLELDPADFGFAVEREYEAIDDPEDVRRGDDGTWFVKAGARVRVRLTMVAPARRYHVALVDPLPAGLEVINPDLAVSETLPGDPEQSLKSAGRYWWWWRPWYDHQNMRDERVEAFAALLWDGVHTYTYVARATTLGEFVVPPTKAEEMYSPETFGRAKTDRLIVR